MTNTIDQIVALETQVRKYLLKLTRDPQRTDDLVQDVMLKAIEKHEQHDLPTADSVRTWMLRIAKTTMIDQYRKGKTLAKHFAVGAEVPEQAVTDGLTEIFRDVREALPKLEPMQRRIIAAKMRGESRVDIQERFGVSEATARRKIRAAVASLEDAIGG